VGSQTNDETLKEIRRLERELYLKKSRVAAAQKTPAVRSTLLGEGLDPATWEKVFAELREKIGMFSKGGDSVADVRSERDP
jgi:hypothetical protein